MGMNELQQRIHRFREDYLETPVGRNHYQIVVREHTEVQEIFRGLRTKQKAGEDITEEVLKRLLPYSDTENNRQRGTHISTWPCITKDVKMWFEGARWKDPGDWESAASWLLDIAEAGQLEDWGRWRSLATMPIQKGFACGFITPVVHCLHPKLPVINSQVVRSYTNVAIELGLASEISAALEEYPENQQKILELLT